MCHPVKYAFFELPLLGASQEYPRSLKAMVPLIHGVSDAYYSILPFAKIKASFVKRSTSPKL